MKRETYKKFSERVRHHKDDLFAILFLNFITVRLAYIITRFKINITANTVTYIRMFLISPVIILLLIIAPILKMKILYIIILILSYLFLLSDWLDGQIARGTKTISKKGEILDSVADRFSTIILLTTIFSIGVLYSNIFIVSMSVFLFVLKCFHMMVITKLYYYEVGNKGNAKKIFDGEDAMGILGIRKIFKLSSKIIRIKRWSGTLGGSDRFFLTIMLPIILLLLGYINLLSLLILGFILFLMIFFMIRIKNLFKCIE